MNHPLLFEKETVIARFIAPSGEPLERHIEIRTHPVTRRTSRVTFSRIAEKEAGTDKLPQPPSEAMDISRCPFCAPQVESKTPMLLPELVNSRQKHSDLRPATCDLQPASRLVRGDSILFPNLFPYGAYSAVSLFDNTHFVEIGTASLESYTNSFLNCADYLRYVLNYDPDAIYMSITQNHLPSAGGSLVHPHLQVHADRIASNHHRFLRKRAEEYFKAAGTYLFSDYLRHEKEDGARYIGHTGSWEWLAAFAPEGFFELWGILPGITSLSQIADLDWKALSRGLLNTQKFYRSLCRNGYNLGILFAEDGTDYLELRVVIMVRSNYAPWTRNDHTGFEVMLGDMATFTAPEETAKSARAFWN